MDAKKLTRRYHSFTWVCKLRILIGNFISSFLGKKFWICSNVHSKAVESLTAQKGRLQAALADAVRSRLLSFFCSLLVHLILIPDVFRHITKKVHFIQKSLWKFVCTYFSLRSKKIKAKIFSFPLFTLKIESQQQKNRLRMLQNCQVDGTQLYQPPSLKRTLFTSVAFFPKVVH